MWLQMAKKKDLRQSTTRGEMVLSFPINISSQLQKTLEISVKLKVTTLQKQGSEIIFSSIYQEKHTY